MFSVDIDQTAYTTVEPYVVLKIPNLVLIRIRQFNDTLSAAAALSRAPAGVRLGRGAWGVG